jgi:hypothetical protein
LQYLRHLSHPDLLRQLYPADLHRRMAEVLEAGSAKEKILPSDCKLRRVKYLNNVIEQE